MLCCGRSHQYMLCTQRKLEITRASASAACLEERAVEEVGGVRGSPCYGAVQRAPPSRRSLHLFIVHVSERLGPTAIF